MADIVDIAQHLPVQDPELIEYLVSLVAEARNGRLTVQAFVDFDAVHKHFE